MKTRIIKQSELTPECWLIQMWGIDSCNDCEALNTDECGGQEIRKVLLKQEAFDREIMKRDYEREIYRQCDEEDRLEND